MCSLIRSLGIVGLSLVLVECSTKPATEGQCSLDCSQAIIGSTEFKIKSTGMTPSFKCAAPGDFGTPVTLQFRVIREIKLSESKTAERTVPYISVAPNVIGVMTNAGVPAENLEADSSGRAYNGIITPRSQWCSDSCGVITIAVKPVCLAKVDNPVSVQVQSGGLFSEIAKIDITGAQ